MADYAWKQGDTEPLEVELISSHAPSWTLTGSVVMNMKRQGQSTLIINRGACEIISGTDHTVRFRPSTTQTTQTAGTYLAEFENTDEDGIIRTFPSGKDDAPNFYEIEIVAQLG